jgi:hypothetical protein
MIIIDAIDPFIFFISLSIGLFFAYVTAKTPRIVFKYPTPYNADKIIYTDTVGTCYKYKVKQTECPKDISKITPVLFQ